MNAQKLKKHQPQRSGKQHIAHTRGVTERTNWWDTTPAAIQIFGTRDRTTQTTPERTSKLMDTRAALVRRPTSTCRHSRRFVAGASSRHESLLPKGKTFLTVAIETRAHVNHMVGNCWCEPPHKRKRASNDLHPPTQRHAKTQNDRQSSRTPAHGPRNDNHNRTCRKIRIDISQLGLRCASLIPQTHTTPHTHPALRVHRPIPCSTLTAKEWCRNISARSKRKATCNTTTKTQNMPTHLKTPDTSRKLPPPHQNELPQSVRRVVCSGAQSDPSHNVDTRRANECTQRTRITTRIEITTFSTRKRPQRE